MSKPTYIHGYSEREQQRLLEQNTVLAKYIYRNIVLNSHQKVLEIGCGVGAQMHHMLQTFPNLEVHGLEISPLQIHKANELLSNSGIDPSRYQIIEGDAKNLPQGTLATYDGIILIWVLEHIQHPHLVLKELKNKAASGTLLYITEVFHNGFNVHPSCDALESFWKKMIHFQASSGGDANIGLTLGNILFDENIEVKSIQPFNMFFDKRSPAQRIEMMTYWRDLMHSAVPEMIEADVLVQEEWDEVESHMNQLIDMEDSVFYYSFIQAFAIL